MYPKIYLAIDNCLFYKRWTSPDEWAEQVARLGLHYIEASADTELDPAYMGKAYVANWAQNVKRAQEKHGVEVCNLYSGHGTYTTLGLTHTDARVREHMIEDWFYPMVAVAGDLRCGLGFFAHAFSHAVLQSKALYDEYVEILYNGLARINMRAGEVGCGALGIEQMYTPHQYPWRLGDTRDLLREVTKRSGRPFYFTEDLGHHHTKFMGISKDALENVISNIGTDGFRGAWLGTDRAFELAEQAAKLTDADERREAIAKIEAEMEANPQLFSVKQDGDCFENLRTLGCYSPIVHLQQTNGLTSAHLPFTAEQNAAGIVTGERVLQAIKQAYDAPDEPGMPPKCDKIYLTLELFSGTTSIMRDVMKDCKASVDYWRKYVPEDGLELDKLVD